jgi:hypothetical protein
MTEHDKSAAADPAAAKGTKSGTGSKIQGEGDYAADRRYRKRTDAFLKEANVEQVARAAAPKSAAEAQEMAEAEKEGRAHAHLSRTRGTQPKDKPPDEPHGR